MRPLVPRVLELTIIVWTLGSISSLNQTQSKCHQPTLLNKLPVEIKTPVARVDQRLLYLL